MLGVAYTSPTLTSVACVASIPVAALVDWLLWRKEMTWLPAGGCVLICVGFVALAVSEARVNAARARACEEERQ